MINTEQEARIKNRPSAKNRRAHDKITSESLQSLGFLSLDNGQFEINLKDAVLLCYFVGENTVSLKKMSKSMPMSLRYGYHQTVVAENVVSLRRLKHLVSNN